MLPGYCSQVETLWNNWSRMRDRGTDILTKMFVSIRGIQRCIKKKITLSQHDDAVLTKNSGNEKFATFFTTTDSSRRAESNIDMVFFKRLP